MQISVIISNYNNAIYLKECLDSVFKQNKISFECIVIDDCSSDESVIDIFSQYESMHPNFKLIKHVENKGCGEARITGLKYATGDYIIFLDSDDYYLNDHYLYDLYAAAVETGSDIARAGYTDQYGEHFEQTKSIITNKQERIDIFNAHHVTSFWTVLTKRDLWKDIEYSPRPCIEDTPTYVKILLAANQIIYVENAGYCYRDNPTSIIRTVYPLKYQLFNTLSLCDIIDECKKYDVKFIYTKTKVFDIFFSNAQMLGWNEESFKGYEKWLNELDQYYEKYLTEK
jgi:glycosyltransferase involved in cell wall biosynthesis